jgi:hypothetical protein
VVNAESKYDGQFFIILPNSDLRGHKTEIEIAVLKDSVVIDYVKTSFIGPIF